MPDTSPDFDFISIDDLGSEERQSPGSKSAPKGKPVPMSQTSLNASGRAGVRGAVKPTTGRRSKAATPATPLPTAEKSRMVIVQRRRKRGGRESAMAAAVGVLLIAVAVGMYLSFAPLSTPPPLTARAPKIYKVPPLPPPPPATEVQAAVTSGVPIESDLGTEEAAAATVSEPATAATGQEMDIDTSVTEFLGAWRTAWENTAGPKGVLGPYRQCYAPQFTHSGMDRAAWMADKGQKNSRKEWIRVRLSDIRVAAPAKDDTVLVTFFQNYASSNYTEASEKTLLLKKSGNSWQILGIQQP